MPSTYSPLLNLELPATGEQAGIWGVTTNRTVGTLIEDAIAGLVIPAAPTLGTYTLSVINGAVDEARSMGLNFTQALTGNLVVYCPAQSKVYVVLNNTTGAFTLTLQTAAGTGVLIPQGGTAVLFCDGVNVKPLGTYSPALTGIPTAPTAAAATNTTQIATTAFVAATAFSSALPSQVGAAGLVVTSNGTVASWAHPYAYAVDTGVTNAYVVAVSPSVAALVDGMPVYFKAATVNTGASTLNYNALGAVAITSYGGAALGAGQIVVGGIYCVIYSAAAGAWLLLSQSAGAVAVANATAANQPLALGQLSNNTEPVAFTTGAFSGALTVLNAAAAQQPVAYTQANARYAFSGADGLGTNKIVIPGSYQILSTNSGLTFDPWSATAGFVLTLPLTAGNAAPLGFNLIIGPNSNGGTILIPGTAVVSINLPDGTQIVPGSSFTMPLGVGHAFRIYEFASSFRLETIGRTIVANAVNANEAVALGQFPASLAANGYQKLANGLIMQWGADLIPLNTTSTLNYPIAFPTAVLQHIAGTKIDGPASGTRNDATGGAGFSLSQYQSRQGSASGSITISWIALGY